MISLSVEAPQCFTVKKKKKKKEPLYFKVSLATVHNFLIKFI